MGKQPGSKPGTPQGTHLHYLDFNIHSFFLFQIVITCTYQVQVHDLLLASIMRV